MSEQELRIAIAQINLLVGDMEGNARRIVAAMQEARDTLGADVLVTPELALTGYPPEDLLLRPGMYERIDRALLHLQKQVRGIDVLLGYPEYTPEGVYNAAALIREGKIIAHARKENLPNYSVFDEKRYFVPEHDNCVVHIKGASVGITICEDIWFPEPPQRLREAGADLILNINASPYHINKGYEREQAVADRCRETGLPVVYTNLVGGQDELVFDGDSFVMNGQGSVTQRVPAFTEKLELVRFEKEGQDWQPVQAEALPAPLSTTASVYQALVLGVRDFVRKNGFNGVVIGLSGGIDSALTLAIAVDALGSEEIEAVMMPSRYTADMSVEDAAEQARTLSVNYRVIAIEKPFNAFLEILADEFAGLPMDTTEENIQARCRGVLLMAISNKKRKMVLTTGNKSEMAVGYATLYGDMAGGFDVLKDVPKTLVYELANYRNTLSAVIPQRVIDRPPSAELAPDQQDTDSLPPYEVLDAILEMYVEKDMGLDDIVSHGYDREIVQKVTYMVTRNEYKRRQAPPGIRITQRAFGRDRRYPITSGYALPDQGRGTRDE
ncbi:NAD+ synthase [Thiohalophilus sp.]|uniref:NAD+ synthase n=1 Tax=Thiohalophilus sp. TaxID=3028392 RepID=UPI002ACDF817|nr:NAD+ synthase [Thiohalophilus sp.]MDZ7802431.1 NAD+ synthase [Thiohalophilus sp.]